MDSVLAALLQLPESIPDTTRTVSEAVKVVLLVLSLGLVGAWRWLPAKVSRGLLIALVVLSFANYSRWGPRVFGWNTDNYDLYHYYLNAKYFDELGYYDLYPAGILADHLNGGPTFDEGNRYMAQTEEGHGFAPIGHALARGQRVRDVKFTPERWDQFVHDALYLQRSKGAFSDKLWRQMIQDHGFNGTPAWTALAKPLASIVPVEHVKVLCYVDVVLLAAAVVVVGWAYGVNPALWCTFFLFIGYSTRWPTISWSYLRYDWVFSLLVALSLIKKGKHFIGGLFAGHAAAVRFFPAMWLFGPGTKGVFELLGGKVNKQLLLLAAGFFLAFGGLAGLGAAVVGTDNVEVHFENMMDHNSPEQLSSRRIGLAVALPFEGDLEPKFISRETKAEIADQKSLRFLIAALVLAGFAWALRRARDDEAFAFGFIPFFLLTTASYYYYVARITLIVIHAADLKKPRNIVGLAMLLGLELFSNWAETQHSGHRVFLIGYLAWGCAAYALVMMVLFGLESRAKDKAIAQQEAA